MSLKSALMIATTLWTGAALAIGNGAAATLPGRDSQAVAQLAGSGVSTDRDARGYLDRHGYLDEIAADEPGYLD